MKTWACVWCGKEKSHFLDDACCAPDGDGHLFRQTQKYQVIYRNQGKLERTPLFDTREKAEEGARFLKFQGATSVMIRGDK